MPQRGTHQGASGAGLFPFSFFAGPTSIGIGQSPLLEGVLEEETKELEAVVVVVWSIKNCVGGVVIVGDMKKIVDMEP